MITHLRLSEKARSIPMDGSTILFLFFEGDYFPYFIYFLVTLAQAFISYFFITISINFLFHNYNKKIIQIFVSYFIKVLNKFLVSESSGTFEPIELPDRKKMNEHRKRKKSLEI